MVMLYNAFSMIQTMTHLLNPLRSDWSIGHPLQPSIGPDFLLSVSLHPMTSPGPHILAGLSFSKTSSVCPSACPLRVPLKGQAGDVSGRLPQSVADPSPFSSPDGDFNPLLLCTLPQLLIQDLSGPPHSQDVPESAIGKGLKLGDDLLC